MHTLSLSFLVADMLARSLFMQYDKLHALAFLVLILEVGSASRQWVRGQILLKSYVVAVSPSVLKAGYDYVELWPSELFRLRIRSKYHLLTTPRKSFSGVLSSTMWFKTALN